MAATMPALRMHAVGSPPWLDEIPVPEPGPGEVRVRVHACGICGYDLAMLAGRVGTGPLPLVLGHEASGVVDAVGDGVAEPAPGRRVVMTAGYGCRQCYACQAGRENVCPHLVIPGKDRDGAQATYVVLPVRALVPVPDEVDLVTAAVISDAVAAAFHAVTRSGPAVVNDAVAVFGCGGVGLALIKILSQLHHADVIAVDTRPAALERAIAAGARLGVDATEPHVAQRIRHVTGGGVGAAFEAVGSPAVVDQAVTSLRGDGVCTVLGITQDRLGLLPQETLVRYELRVQGSYGSTRAEVAEVLALVADKRLDLSGLVTHEFPLSAHAEAVEIMSSKEHDPIRVVLTQA